MLCVVTGSFLLASSRFVMQSGSITRLFGPSLPGNQKFCLQFYYSLRGFSKSEHVLAVYLYNSTAQKHSRVWSPTDTTRDVWIHVELGIQTQNNTQVMTLLHFYRCFVLLSNEVKLLHSCALFSVVEFWQLFDLVCDYADFHHCHKKILVSDWLAGVIKWYHITMATSINK